MTVIDPAAFAETLAAAARRAARPVLAAAAVLVLLAGCYLPDDFNVAIQVAEDGRYAFRYEGDLTQLQFLQRIGNGELEGDKLAEYVDIYGRDLKRDSGFKSLTYEGQARYAVRYERADNLQRTRQFSFPRRNAAFIGLRLKEDGRIELFGDRLPQRHREELMAKGFNSQGVVRVWVQGTVVSHNATRVVDGAPTLYEWRVESMRDSTPSLILAPDS